MEIIGVGFGLFFVLLMIGSAGLAVGATVLWIWMLVDCASKEPDEGNEKLVWILIIILTHWIGALIYLIVRRPERIRQTGR